MSDDKTTYKSFNSIVLQLGAAAMLLLPACRQSPPMQLIPPAANFERTIAGKATHLYVLDNHHGMQAAITNYGGRLVSLVVPDKNGKATSVVDGFENLDGYINSTEPYFGATIGRYGNRIAKGSFKVAGKSFQSSLNNGPNMLHGGKHGFQYQVWDAKQNSDSSLVLTYLSKDLEEGFPGNLNVTVTYTVTATGELRIDYSAKTDKPTVLNLTNHAFFNLNGEGSGTILTHTLQLFATQYTPVDSTLIPTGMLANVAETPFDFRKPQGIGLAIGRDDQQLKFGKGYDHNFVLAGEGPFKKAAVVSGDKSGIVMEVETDQPGLQFYSGNFMQSKNRMRKGRDDFRTAFCLETQHFPDSPNHINFPSTELKPGETYQSRSVYRFSVKK